MMAAETAEWSQSAGGGGGGRRSNSGAVFFHGSTANRALEIDPPEAGDRSDSDGSFANFRRLC